MPPPTPRTANDNAEAASKQAHGHLDANPALNLVDVSSQAVKPTLHADVGPPQASKPSEGTSTFFTELEKAHDMLRSLKQLRGDNQTISPDIQKLQDHFRATMENAINVAEANQKNEGQKSPTSLDSNEASQRVELAAKLNVNATKIGESQIIKHALELRTGDSTAPDVFKFLELQSKATGFDLSANEPAIAHMVYAGWLASGLLDDPTKAGFHSEDNHKNAFRECTKAITADPTGKVGQLFPDTAVPIYQNFYNAEKPKAAEIQKIQTDLLEPNKVTSESARAAMLKHAVEIANSLDLDALSGDSSKDADGIKKIAGQAYADYAKYIAQHPSEDPIKRKEEASKASEYLMRAAGCNSELAKGQSYKDTLKVLRDSKTSSDQTHVTPSNEVLNDFQAAWNAGKYEQAEHIIDQLIPRARQRYEQLLAEKTAINKGVQGHIAAVGISIKGDKDHPTTTEAEQQQIKKTFDDQLEDSKKLLTQCLYHGARAAFAGDESDKARLLLTEFAKLDPEGAKAPDKIDLGDKVKDYSLLGSSTLGNILHKHKQEWAELVPAGTGVAIGLIAGAVAVVATSEVTLPVAAIVVLTGAISGTSTSHLIREHFPGALEFIDQLDGGASFASANKAAEKVHLETKPTVFDTVKDFGGSAAGALTTYLGPEIEAGWASFAESVENPTVLRAVAQIPKAARGFLAGALPRAATGAMMEGITHGSQEAVLVAQHKKSALEAAKSTIHYANKGMLTFTIFHVPGEDALAAEGSMLNKAIKPEKVTPTTGQVLKQGTFSALTWTFGKGPIADQTQSELLPGTYSAARWLLQTGHKWAEAVPPVYGYKLADYIPTGYDQKGAEERVGDLPKISVHIAEDDGSGQ